MILTTHSMEEADFLADKIGIMSAGTLITYDTSLNLRNQFGNGYKLNFVTKPENVNELISAVGKHLPQATLVTSNAGSICFTVTRSYLKYLSRFFRELQLELSANAILDWGISHSCKYGNHYLISLFMTIFIALEEVFHNVTHLSDEEIRLLQNGELLVSNPNDHIDNEDLDF